MAIIENKYFYWYYKIVNSLHSRVKFTGSERHHIIPKSLGGTNEDTNLVYLTPREHFVCHLLLAIFTDGRDKKLMDFAVGKFIQSSPTQQRKFTSWEYAKIRESIRSARSGSKHSVETKRKMSAAKKGKVPPNKGQRGVYSRTNEFKHNLSIMYTGKSLVDRYGEEKAKEIRDKISNSKLGNPSGMLGKTHPAKGKTGMWKMSDEGKRRVSDARKGMQFSDEHLANLTAANILNGKARRGKKQELATCIHCGKVGGVGAINRYHNHNCKFK